MLVKHWMSENVITIDEDVSIMKASKLMKHSDRDLKEAHPSQATTLDIHELYYLLDKLKVEKVMSKNLHTARAAETVDKAAALMLKHKISALPVIDQEGKLEGIITKGDVFRAMVSISGIQQAPLQLCFEIEDRPGTIREVTDVIRAHGGRIVSSIANYEYAPAGFRHLYIRPRDVQNEKALITELKTKFKLIYQTHDEVE
jgi:acetoin utilization protein AcuB